MFEPARTSSLRGAFTELCAEREDQGLESTLVDVFTRAGVSRETAYRGRPIFDEAIAVFQALREGGTPLDG